MSNPTQLEISKCIAADAHEGQTDDLGRPYLGHCERIADAMTSNRLKAVAYLHDVVEKSERWSLERLAAAGVAFDIVCAVDALTRRVNEGESSYLCRVYENELARQVKIEDLKDNLDEAQQSGNSVEKYLAGLAFMQEAAPVPAA